MRSASGRFHLGLGKRSNTDDRGERERDVSGSDQGGDSRVVSGSGSNNGSGGNAGFGGRTGTGALLKGRVAHTGILPNFIGNSELRQLQDLIHSEKSVLQSVDRTAAEFAKAQQCLSLWGQTEGSDLADITTHASLILSHLPTGYSKFSMHQADQRAIWKSVRTREEELDDLQKRRRNTYARAEKEEKKLAKMSQENKNLHSQTELLSSLRDQIRHMDTDIVTEEAKIGDFKRRATKEALGIKFNGLLELAEHLTIVGELGKLLIEEIPLEETPPGYGRAPYQSYATTERLSSEAAKCISQVVFHPPHVAARPPGLPHMQPLAPNSAGSAGQQEFAMGDGVPSRHEQSDVYRRYAEAYSDDPGAPVGDATRATAPKLTRFQSEEVTPIADGLPHTPPTSGPPQLHKIMFDAPLSPPVPGGGNTAEHGYEYEQAAADAAQGLGQTVAPPLDSVTGQTHLEPLNTSGERGFTQTQQYGDATEQLNSPEPFSAVSRTGEGTLLSSYASEAIVQPAQHAHSAHATSARVSRLGGSHAEGLGGHGLAHPMTTSFASATVAPTPAPLSAAYDHDLKEDGPRRVLRIEDWVIETVKKPILNGPEIDAASADLDIPLPEMTFGNNSLTLQYTPSPSAPGISIRFDALLALSLIPKGPGWESVTGGAVQVAMAQSWGAAQATARAAGQKTMLSEGPIPDAPAKPFDWTYSTTFAGDIYVLGGSGDYDFQPSTVDKIPMDLLARQDPVLDKILFYDDVPLYEDELHDNGESILNVRIRVMPHSFFILSRLFLRVDGVLFRTFDTRVFHQFGSGKVIREVCGRECSYADIKSRLESSDDLTPLTDPNFVTQALASIPIASAQLNEKLWPGLGIRTEVLVLPSPTGDAGNASHAASPAQPETVSCDAVSQITTPPSSAGATDPTFATPPPVSESREEGTYESPNRPSIMSRGRMSRRGDDAGADVGYNYGYDNTAYFVRNHASSPNSIPRGKKSLPVNPESSEIPPINEYRENEREAFGAGLPTPVGDREAFYTPSENVLGSLPAPPRVHSPAIGSTNGTGGPRKIAAGAFRRNKPTPAIAASPAALSTARSEGSPSGSPRHSQQYTSPQIAQQTYTPVQVSSGDYSAEPYSNHQREAALDDSRFSDPGVDPSLGLGSPLPPPAYGNSHGDAAANDIYADAAQQGYQQNQLVARDTDDGHLR